MSDPRKVKLTGKLVLKVKLNETEEILDLIKPVDDTYKSMPPQIVEEVAKVEVEKITDKAHTTLYKSVVSFSYPTKDALKDFDFGNVLIEAYLPYCFLIPNNSDILVSIPELDFKALITFEKIWTNRAQTEDGKSDNIDYYTEKVPLYFKGSTILGPKIPFEEENGWEHYITGRNVEKIKDKNGVFRYSKVYIQLNLTLPEEIEQLSDSLRDQLFNEIKDKTLTTINRVIDTYRDITNEAHIRKMGSISINLIYFIPQNVGYYLSDYNITAAMMNRSGKEIDELESRLSKGIKPDFYKLLLLNAKSSFDSKDFTMAIVESFQALEIFLENYLVSEFKKRGDKKSEYTKILNKHWNTKMRLNDVLNIIKGVKLNTQLDIWNKWCHHYDKTRNEVIHDGREPIEKETKETMEINENVINWVLSLK